METKMAPIEKSGQSCWFAPYVGNLSGQLCGGSNVHLGFVRKKKIVPSLAGVVFLHIDHVQN